MTDREVLSEVRRTIREEAESLQKLADRFDEASVLKVTDALQNCRGKVILTGCGTSGMAAKGGKTSELLTLIPACKTKQALLIGVSENPESEIARSADIYLEVKVDREPDRFNMLATASTLAVISMFDAICIALTQLKGYTREQFAVIHPHGAVGERLLKHLD